MGTRREWGESIRWRFALFGCCIAVLIGIAAFQTDAYTIPSGALSSPPSLPAMEIASAAPGAPSIAVSAAAPVPERPAKGGQRAPSGEPGSEAVRASIRARYGRIPMHFEPNLGQTADEVRYLARGPGYTLFLTEKEAVLVLRKGLQDTARRDDERGAGASLPTRSLASGKRAELKTPSPAAVVRMRLEGTARNAAPKVAGLERLPGVSNYLLGNDLAKWRSGVPHYARVRYSGVYPGIDLVFYGNPRQLEYDFVVAAGADPERIRLSFQGADDMRIDADGNLVLAVAGGELVQRAPRIYQEVNGTRRPIAGGYRLLSVDDTAERATDAAEPDRSVAFRLAAYDGTRSLVIDPVLEYSTYLGGSKWDGAFGVAVDAAGNSYVAGRTRSPDFPVANARYPNLLEDSDAFVVKFDPAGQGPVYATYLGGSNYDSALGIAVDASGNAYVAGVTWSPDFPTVNARYPNFGGGRHDAFVVKLDPAGQGPVYATYLGGSSREEAWGIATDFAGNAYVTGWTESSDFPTVNALYPNHGGGLDWDAFVVKLNPEGQGPVYATYLGGSEWDRAYGIAADAAGNACVAGVTSSSDFPAVNARYPNLLGDSDAFVVKFDPAGQVLVYATYLGGSARDEARGIAADAAGNAYVTGATGSLDFPVVNARYPNPAGSSDAFVVKLDPEGQVPVYATYVGGSGNDQADGIAADVAGNAYVTGVTWSSNFPAVNARYPNPAGGGDAFVVKLDPEGQGPVYATHLGGSGEDRGSGIAADAAGNAYVAGGTRSLDFPAVNALYPNHSGGDADAFVARLTDGVNIRGHVLLADGTPICAMVLANGGYMFSCDGAGSYELSVPLDENGEITLFSFADGFAPFRVTAAPENLPSVVQMQTAALDSPSILMWREVECSTTNRVRIDGTVRSESGQPLCALVLANGQHMFSCDASQGVYDLEVPIDENGQVTIFGFADSFQPYSETFVAPDCTGVPSV